MIVSNLCKCRCSSILIIVNSFFVPYYIQTQRKHLNSWFQKVAKRFFYSKNILCLWASFIYTSGTVEEQKGTLHKIINFAREEACVCEIEEIWSSNNLYAMLSKARKKNLETHITTYHHLTSVHFITQFFKRCNEYNRQLYRRYYSCTIIYKNVSRFLHNYWYLGCVVYLSTS